MSFCRSEFQILEKYEKHMGIKGSARKFLLQNKQINPYRFSWDSTFRYLTNSIRFLPHFLIIGTSKAGKYSVLSYLNQHHEISAGFKDHAGVHYFDGSFEINSISWYRSHFPTKISKFKIVGEAPGTYLTNPSAPTRIKKVLPNVKLINFFRNPVNRAYSAYNHAVRYGWEHSSFENAIEAEIERMNLLKDNSDMKINNENSVNYLQFSYLRHGLYADNLENWFDEFEENQFRHYSTEELDDNYDEIMNSLFTFFGIKNIELTKVKRKNVGVEKVLHEPMKEKIREFLIDFYKPHNEKLFRMIKKEFQW